MNIDEFKKLIKVDTSEAVFGISKQPEQQCPRVDEHLRLNERSIKDVEYNLKEIQRTTDSAIVESNASDAEWELTNLDATLALEELRTKCDDIRSWGQEWKDLAKQLLEERESFIIFLGSDASIKHEALSVSCV